MNKHEFVAAAGRPKKVISVTGIGAVEVRALTLAQRMSLPERFEEDGASATVWVVSQGLVGFDETDASDLAELDCTVLEKIADAVMRLSGLSAPAEGDEKND